MNRLRDIKTKTILAIRYIYYESFSEKIGDGNLDEVLLAFSSCDGLIIDVRDNGGGQLSTVQQLASRFTTEDFTSGYIRHKTGPGHNDFSDFYPITQETAESNRIHFAKPVAILTNRKCYSATNDFVSVMSNLPNSVLNQIFTLNSPKKIFPTDSIQSSNERRNGFSRVYNESQPEKSIQQLFRSFLQPLKKKESLTSS